MSDMATVFERHRITVDEYHRMVEGDVFDPDSRIELIEGELVEMSPIYPPHASTVDRIMHQFVSRLNDRAWVRCQNPVTLPPCSEPQPDLILARPDVAGYRDRHPGPHDILLGVEVAQSSLQLDQRIKIPLYARSGVLEIWIVKVVDSELIAYREPAGAWYASIQTYRRGETIAPSTSPDAVFAVDDLLPPV